MLTLFIPIKIIFVVSGMKSFSFLEEFKVNHGDQFVVISLVLFVGALYFFNIGLHVWKSKLINSDLRKIELNFKLLESEIKVSEKEVKGLYINNLHVCSDFLTLMMAFILSFFMSFWMFVFYTIFLIIYLTVIPSVINFEEDKKVNLWGLTLKQKFKTFNGMFFFPLFVILLALIHLGEVSVFEGVLLIIVLRMSSSSFGAFYTNQIQVRKLFYKL